MIGKLKFLILLVALAALPLRGMAAVAMWHCVQGQHDSAAVSADQHGGHDHAHADSAEPAGHHTPPTDDVSAASASSGDGQVVSTCSACAACCMGATVAPTDGSFSTFAPIGASRIAFVEPHFTGVVPAQLERPPLPQSL